MKKINFAWEAIRMDKTGMMPSESAVLICLAGHSDEDGFSFPSQILISKETALSVRTVVRAVRTLKERGIISYSRSPSKGNGYVINTSAIMASETDDEKTMPNFT